MTHHHVGLTGQALFGAGVVLGVAGGYIAGRWHKAIQHWRSSSRKVRRDWRDVRRGPRW